MQWPKLAIATVALGMGLAAGIYAISASEPQAERQMHPRPIWSSDDCQFFAPGQEFKLSKEAAALKQYAAELQLQNPPR